MFVYRVENQHGTGPYNSRGFLHENMSAEAHPPPCGDGIHDFAPSKHLCGFKSMEQLLEWFDEDALEELAKTNRATRWRRRIALRGPLYHIGTYTVDEDHVMLGEKQLVFEHQHAKHIATMSIEYAQKILEKQNQWLDIPPKWCIM